MKCDYCSKEVKEEIECGRFIFNNLKERKIRLCSIKKLPNHEANPLFESEVAWNRWEKKHKVSARRIIKYGEPSFQYKLNKFGVNVYFRMDTKRQVVIKCPCDKRFFSKVEFKKGKYYAKVYCKK